MAIDNLHDLSNTITAVVNRALEIVTERSSSSHRYIGHDDVADLITEEDYRNYFELIAYELQTREEVLDLDYSDYELDIVCGLAWCKGYEPLPEEGDIEFGYEKLEKQVSMARLAEIGEKMLKDMVIRGGPTVIDPKEYGVTEEELAYMRSITGYDQPDLRRRPNKQIADKPVTQKEYEKLIIDSSMRHDKAAYEGTDPLLNMGNDHPFYICVNTYGQMEDKVLNQYPEAKKNFEEIFSHDSETPAFRWGAMIDGRPALVYSYDFDEEQFINSGIEDPNVRHALVAMVAGHMDAIFNLSNIKVTYGICTSEAQSDEILAILPADGDLELLRQFEKVFTETLNEIPFTTDPLWVQKQYEAVCEHLKEKMPTHCVLSPWTLAAPDRCAMYSCQALGRYIGQNQHEWDQAALTHNSEKLDSLESRFDASKNFVTLSNVTNEGLFNAESNLSEFVKLYTDAAHKEKKAEFFHIPLGKLIQTLHEMGYKKDYPVSDFLLSYSVDTAREVKAVSDQLPRQSLAQQMRSAEARNTQGTLSRETPEKDRGRNI